MIWGVVGGVTAVCLEILYRRGLEWNGWGVVVAIPLALLVSFSVSKLVQAPGSFIAAVAWFGASTTLIRIAVAYLFLHEEVGWKTLLASGALIVAAMTRFL